MLVSKKVKKQVEADVKELDALIKNLVKEAEAYDVDNSAKIQQIQDVIGNYKNILKQ